MAELRQMMETEVKHMQTLLKKLEENGEDPGDSTLRISVDKGKPRYYVKYERGGYEYISRSNIDLARTIAQNQYNKKLRKLLEKRTAQFQRILRDYADAEIDDVYDQEHSERKALVIPLEETRAQKYDEWIREGYEGKVFQEGAPLILTEKGERVRSKSEKILADYFYHKGIDYKYEKPLLLRDVGTVYPDFTFLSKKTGEEIYWEHDGRMDDPAYAKTAVKKINAYVKNGIIPGKNLILTYETSTVTLDMGCVAAYVQVYL